jgi:cbb3-type cytochrome oxidase cytochrome c subunit
LLGVIVIIVVSNLLLSLRGSGFFPRDLGLRFAWMSTIFYLIVSVQGSMQAQMSINQAVHFTDWVIGHSHLAMLGFATFAGIGGIIHAWQRIPEASFNARLLEWSWWLLFSGISVMVVDLTIAGVVEARLWLGGAPWLESLRAAQPYWIVRTLSAVPIAAGFVLLLTGLVTGPKGAGAPKAAATKPASVLSPNAPRVHPAGATPGRVLMMSYVVAGIAGIAFFVMSVSLLGVWPGRVLATQTELSAPENPLALTASELRGREIYAAEGCAYCHTQQIRYTEADIRRFGLPTVAWETRFDYPHLFGTRRIGPDLSRAGATRTADWHYAHLFAPRSVVPLSIMPSYEWLFAGAPDRPRQAARDLVAYIESLGRARELAWPEGDAAARAALPEDRWTKMAFGEGPLNAHPARTRPRGGAPELGPPAPRSVGLELWKQHCTGCHGTAGQGDGPAADWLKPAPPDLSLREYKHDRLADILWNGVAGSSMPAWRDQPLENLAALAAVVRSFEAIPASASPTAAELSLGKSVYEANCYECHGENGRGDGFAAGEFPIAPTDFTGERLSLAASIAVLSAGIEGTSMASWTDRLSAGEILAVAHYVREFFDSGDDE